MMNSLEMAHEVIKTLDAKKAVNIRALQTAGVTSVADYFVICTANSTTHIKTLSDEIQKAMEEKGEHALHVEGYRSGGWVLVDYGCVIVHLFLKEIREFYALERLWGDAPELDISNLITE